MKYVVAYDISDDNRRARVSAALAAWGNRVQLSIFECTLQQDDLEELVARLETIVDSNTDVVQAYRQCASCHEASVARGQAKTFSADPYWIV